MLNFEQMEPISRQENVRGTHILGYTSRVKALTTGIKWQMTDTSTAHKASSPQAAHCRLRPAILKLIRRVTMWPWASAPQCDGGIPAVRSVWNLQSLGSLCFLDLGFNCTSGLRPSGVGERILAMNIPWNIAWLSEKLSGCLQQRWFASSKVEKKIYSNIFIQTEAHVVSMSYITSICIVWHEI